jgi:hypothetical protein
MSAFVEGDRVIITSEDHFDAEVGIIVKVDQPDPEDFIGGAEEWQIDEATTYLVRFEDGGDAWFDAVELGLA